MSDLLAIETSSSACSVALGQGADVVARHRVAPRQQIELVLPLIDALCAERRRSLGELGGIAFGEGPGSFTGIRIALAVAQGLAFAHDLPVVGVSSLAALAQGAHRCTGGEAFLVAQDARLGEIYWAAYEIINGRAVLQGAEQLTAPAGLRPPAGRDWLSVGDAWQTYDLPPPSAARYPGDAPVSPTPHARDVLALAEPAFAQGLAIPASQARASYLREQVAHRSGRRHN